MKKKVVLALGTAALGVVAATGVTSGFAWFAVNETVAVTGLQVRGVSDQPYLLIAKGTQADVAAVRTNKEDNNTANAALNSSLRAVTYLPADPAYTITELETKTNWGVAYSDDIGDAQTDLDAEPLENTADLSKYVASATFTVGLAAGSAACTGLYVNTVTFTTNDWDETGMTLVLATSEGGLKFTGNVTAETGTPTAARRISTAAMTSESGVITFKAYVYCDGKSEGVKNINLDDIADTIQFSLKTVTTN